MPKKKSIRSRLILYSSIILIAVIVVWGIVDIRIFYKKYTWKNNTEELAKVKVKGEVIKIQKVLLSIEQIPLNLAYVLEFANPQKGQMKVLLESIVQNNDEVFGTCIAYEPYSYDKDTLYYAPYVYKKDGKLIYVNPTDSSVNYYSMDWYLLPKTLNQPVWIEPYYDDGSTGGNVIMSTYTAPFYSYNGKEEKFSGIVEVDISLDWLSKIVRSIKLNDESFSVLVSENGTIIASPIPQWAYNESLFSLAEEKGLPLLRNVGRDLQKGKSGFIKIGKLEGKKDWWVYYMPIKANNWGVLLFIPEG